MDNFSNLIMDECPPDLRSPDEENNKESSTGVVSASCKRPAITKGVSMSFGFKKRTASAPHTTRTANAQEFIDRNGNGRQPQDSFQDTMTENTVPTGRSTPRLAPPKKEAASTRLSRFGFRQPQNSKGRVADINTADPSVFCTNNNGNAAAKYMQPQQQDSNRNSDNVQSQACKFTLQSTQLPRPQLPSRLDSKTAKTLANTTMRQANSYHQHRKEDNTGCKNGSSTEDSGFGSHDLFDSSRESHKLITRRGRQLETAFHGGMLNIRDEGGTLPQLPGGVVDRDRKSLYHTTGLVRERTLEYQKLLDQKNRRINSAASSNLSDDCEEKSYRDRVKKEKLFIKQSNDKTYFNKSDEEAKNNSSINNSSDDFDWTNAGEAMADEFSFSLSSGDTSKDKIPIPLIQNLPHATSKPSSSLNSITASICNSFPKADMKNVLLTIEDPKFAAVAAIAATANNGRMLDEETSPVDSMISCSESDEMLKENKKCSSDSKDINEKLTQSTPASPTVASNSLSLSEGKDDFLIDDEIADQPELVMQHKLIINDKCFDNNQSIDSAAGIRRKISESSPLLSRRKIRNNHTGSLDTLSPCDSISSDDLMLDFEISHNNGFDECRNERSECGFSSWDDSSITLRIETENRRDSVAPREWSTLLGNCSNRGSDAGFVRQVQLLQFKSDGPNSLPDSPCSLDRSYNNKVKSSIINSGRLKLARSGLISNHGSNDDLKVDRQSHAAIRQDVVHLKSMLLKLRRVLAESEAPSPFISQRGLMSGDAASSGCLETEMDETKENHEELGELRRQVLFLQCQLDDRERMVQQLQLQVVQLASDESSVPTSSTDEQGTESCNAATQTERIRPGSVGPSVLNSISHGMTEDSLVSMTEHRIQNQRNCHGVVTSFGYPTAACQIPPRRWQKEGKLPSPQRYPSISAAQAATRESLPI